MGISYDSSTKYEYNMEKMDLTGQDEPILIRMCILFD